MKGYIVFEASLGAELARIEIKPPVSFPACADAFYAAKDRAIEALAAREAEYQKSHQYESTIDAHDQKRDT